MKLTRYLSEGEIVPFGYGFVAMSPDRLFKMEFLPIPLNYIKRYWYHTLRKMKLSSHDKDMLKAQQIAYNEGEVEGFAKGYEKAQALFTKNLLKMEKRLLKRSKV